MPVVEIIDGPPEWAGTVYETDEDMVAEEIGKSHPGWRGTPVGIEWRALFAYRLVEVVGNRHRYRFQGPYGARRHRLSGRIEDLTGWDVLVVQKELGSDDRRKLWGSPIRVYAAPPGTPRPDPARSPEAQDWRELTENRVLRRPRAPGTGARFPPDPAAEPARQGWTELEEGDFLLPWLLHVTMYELCERPCCAPFRLPKPDR
jgi:hypothetical protein